MRTIFMFVFGLAMCATLVAAYGPGAPARSMLQSSDEWREGRATWYDHPWTGSCGYGKLDDANFGYDAVFAMPDTFEDYDGMCGKCYEVRCAPLPEAKPDDGSFAALDRSDACHDETTAIIVKAVDTCPCVGNEKWCCGSVTSHFDLSKEAFAKLAPEGKGIIGLKWRRVPCEAAENGGSASEEAWQRLETALSNKASFDVFMNGDMGIGWAKTVYGDDARAMYTYESSIEFKDGDPALCTTVAQYGGFDFHTQTPDVKVFSNSKAVEFWAETSNGVPNLAFRISNRMRGVCNKEVAMGDYATQDVENGWTRFYFPIEVFDCTGAIKVQDLNRVQWENQNSGKVSVCVKDVRLIPQDEAAVASAGRR